MSNIWVSQQQNEVQCSPIQLILISFVKMPQSGIVQALYATPVWACFFLMYFILGGYVKYNLRVSGGVG